MIPAFNAASFIARAVDSVLAQTYPNIEIIVVSSTDNTVQVIQPILDRITYLEKANGGKSTVLNLVMPDIKSDYVWIFDDDDVTLADALEIHVATLESNPYAGFTYSTWYFAETGVDGQILRGRAHTLPDITQDEFFVRLLEANFIFAHAAIVVRTICRQNVGPFDTTLIRSQDYDMLLRLSRRFASLSIDKPTFLFRDHSGLRGNRMDCGAEEVWQGAHTVSVLPGSCIIPGRARIITSI